MMEESMETDERFVSIDDVIPYVGEFKKFQWILGAMFCIIMLPSTYQILIMYFAALSPTWRCVDNSTVCNSSVTFSPDNPLRCSLPRSEWVFTQPKDYSIVTTFDLYCDNAWLKELSTSILFVGWALGAFVIGWSADAYGRRKIIFISIAMVMLSGFVISFVNNIYLFIFFRFITGIFVAGTSSEMCILMSELVASKHRPLAGTFVWCFFPVALCILGLKAYFVRTWTTLFIICSVPYFFVVLFYKYSPESPRWLRLHGKMEELMATLENIARCNKKEIPSHIKILPEVKEQKTNPLHLFRKLNITLLSFNIGYATLTHGMVYYGLSLEASNLGGSLYRNFLLLSVTEIPATFFAIFICNTFGRKRSTIAAVFCAGVACLALGFISTDGKTVRVVLGMIGKLCITISFNTLGIWAIELYPTSLRAQANGFANVTCRIGAGIAPWVVSGFKPFYQTGSYICMGVLAVICAGLLLVLSETKGLRTLETEEDLVDKPVGPEDRPFLDDADNALSLEFED